jgi:ABC-type amino acid transport substrate-binding protein
LARAIGRVLGRPVEVRLMDWSEAQSRLLSGDESDLDPNQLQGKRIGVTKGSFAQQFFKDTQPQVKVVVVDDAIDGTKRLLRGDLDALGANH